MKLNPTINSIKSSSERMLPYWIAAGLTALVSVLYVYIFRMAEEFSFSWFNLNAAWAFLLTPIAMVASMLLAHYFAPMAAGSGIPQILAAVEVGDSPNPILQRILNLRVIAVKLIGSCVCVAGGGVTGREGPMLQIAASIFLVLQKFWQKLFPKSPAPNLQSMILAGGAAGLASAFNTPLGGIIFAIEEMAKVHISQVRTYVFHAVIIAGILAQAFLGNYLYFGRTSVTALGPSEVLPLILATAVIGILGAVFGKVIVGMLDWRARFSLTKKIFSTVVLGFGVATLAYIFKAHAMGSGRDIIIEILNHPNQTAPYYLGFVRGMSNLLTYTGGVIGGVFAPALATGAAFGSWFSAIVPGFNHELWALAGMIAFLTGVTRTPFTSLILVLEMTDTHDVIIYLMLAAIMAQSASKFIDPISFYEHMSHRLLHGKPPEKSLVS